VGGNAYLFDHTTWSPGSGGDEIYVPYSPSLASSQITVSIWLFRASNGYPGQSMTAITRFQEGYDNPNGQTWGIGCYASPNLSTVNIVKAASNVNSQAELLNTGPVLGMNAWTNIIMTFNGSQLSQYVNGNLIGSVQSNTFALNTLGTSGISIGLSNQANGYWNPFYGTIDDIAIYNRALTPQEIQNLYNGSNETVDTGDGAAPLPQGIPYQAAARDAQGQVIADAAVNVRYSLHEGAVDGAVSYSETHALTTSSIGLFNTVFGNGTPEQSAFDSINWAATTKFLQVEIDLGDGYVDMGTTQLLSVPYAFRSDEAARIKNAGLPIFADNAAALAGGLVAGEMYRTATGDLKIVY
jgi:hypothetical protein